jgi:creatinine amidohydrolase
MKPHILRENNWKSVKETGFKIAILPWGATEAHNYHLPYGTDTILAEHIAAEAAELANKSDAGCIVLPSIAYGVNSGQMDIKLCMNMRPSTQMTIIRDILDVLRKHGIKKLVILNAHGGNSFTPIIRELSLDYPDILMSSVNWWVACKPDGFFTDAGDHAGELETASMQYVAPELVLPLSDAGNGADTHFIPQGLREKWAWIPRRWIYTTKDTGVGDPSKATPENGERFVKACIEKIAQYFVDFSAIKSEIDLYEK